MERRRIETDILIIGGGTAGCYAAITAARACKWFRILIVEKANIKRSGCLAAGVNAINAYLTNGQTAEDYLAYVKHDAAGIVRDDLVLSMAGQFNSAAQDLEKMGLTFLKDADGNYVSRGKRNVKINGENIKQVLSDEVARYENITVENHINITDFLTAQDKVIGAVGFCVREREAVVISAGAVLVATGGAAGLYRPNNPGFSKHKMWYPPFLTGAGYAMGIRAGAEMTSLEMRFVALRCKDTIAPTGTLSLGAGATQINRLGENYEEKYGVTTPERAFGTANENREGFGPCYLKTEGIGKDEEEALLKAYLNMAPSQTLKWIETGKLPSIQNVEIEGSEPYIVGGHTGSGYWIDTGRRTTLKGLYAAGDVAGGAPQKFVTGALAEGKIAAISMIQDLPELLEERTVREVDALAEDSILQYEAHLHAQPGKSLFDADMIEEAMQKVMDTYAGGKSTDYRYNEAALLEAEPQIKSLQEAAENLYAADAGELLRIYEVKERLVVCRALIAHMLSRKESRWKGYGIHTDYPGKNDRYLLFVNSVYADGEYRIRYRALTQTGEEEP